MSNPIQQAIEGLESYKKPIFSHAKIEAAISALQSLQGVELPKFPLHDVAATAPGVVWLNIFGVESDYESGFPQDHEGITWCESEVGDLDVPYVRVDRVAAVAAAMARGAVPQGLAFHLATSDPEGHRQAVADHEATQPTQAEAPSEREALTAVFLQAMEWGRDYWSSFSTRGQDQQEIAEQFADKARAALATQQAGQGEVVVWRAHVEQRIRTWRQRTMNRSGDRLAIDDFMDQESIDDLVDFVCDEYATPPAPQQPEALAQQERELTDDEIDEACGGIALADYDKQVEYDRAIARAVLRAARSSEGGAA